MKRFRIPFMQCAALAALVLLAVACASIGRPTGGDRDFDPPIFLSGRPGQGAMHVGTNRIDLYFNENVQLDDPAAKVIVSPVQAQQPVVRANGKHVSVELRDTLVPDATYTIDFGDAIKDLNEGNVLDGFSFDFSTGSSLDTLVVAGMVLEARTLEPAQGMLVGIHSDLSDTAIYTKPFDRVARTNQRGQFAIRGLKPGQYRVYAISDANRNYMWDRGEDLAIGLDTLQPFATAIEVVDTLRSQEGTDSLSVRGGIAFFPNDVLLCWSNDGYAQQYLKDYKRPDRRRITLQMNAPADSLPGIAIAAGPKAGSPIADWAMMHASERLDTLEFWITDPDVLATDSLLLSVRYQRTDTADALAWKTDTLKFFYRDPAPAKKSKDEEADTVPKTVFMGFSAASPSSHDVHRPLVFNATVPIASIDSAAFRLEIAEDTVWTPVEGVFFETDSTAPLTRRLMSHNWIPGAKYRLEVDSGAVHSIYGEPANAMRHEFTVKQLEDYSSLVFKISGLDSLPAMVELLGKNDDPVATVRTDSAGVATFKYAAPGIYYARLYIDANGNGQWDPGSPLAGEMPEDVFYYPKKLSLRRNWDVVQSWDIFETPVDEQKPYEIVKNKPKLRPGEKDPKMQYEQPEEDDGFGGFGSGQGGFGSGFGSGQGGFGSGQGGFGSGQGGFGQGQGGFGRRR